MKRNAFRPSFILESKSSLWIFMFGCTLLGVGIAYGFMPEGTTAAKKVAMGVVGGAGLGFTVVAGRLLGAFDTGEDEENR